MEQNTLRDEFLKIIRANNMKFKKVSEEVGISHKTFRGFIDGSLKTHLQTTWKIEEWIVKKCRKSPPQ